MKPRPPLSPYRALSRIADLLGWDGCASVLDLSESSVRKWGDPDAEREISYQYAIRLDAAFMRAGGDRAPLLECYAARLDLLTDSQPLPNCLLTATARAAKEVGEAIAAALDAAARSHNTGIRAKAAKEAEEGIEALQSLLFSLRRDDASARSNPHGIRAVPTTE